MTLGPVLRRLTSINAYICFFGLYANNLLMEQGKDNQQKHMGSKKFCLFLVMSLMHWKECSGARFVLKIRKYDHITEALKQLHWLPIAYRIKYKIALITFKTLNGQGPSYLRELLLETTSFRQTRSKHKLKIPRTKLKSAGDRSFSVAAPLIWNSLPSNITNTTSIPQFKKKLLKTHLFKLAYAC